MANGANDVHAVDLARLGIVIRLDGLDQGHAGPQVQVVDPITCPLMQVYRPRMRTKAGRRRIDLEGALNRRTRPVQIALGLEHQPQVVDIP